MKKEISFGTTYWGVTQGTEGFQVSQFAFIGDEFFQRHGEYKFIQQGGAKAWYYKPEDPNGDVMYCEETKQYIFSTETAAVRFYEQHQLLKDLGRRFLTEEQVRTLRNMSNSTH